MPPAVRDTPAHRPSARPTGAQTPGLGRTAAAAANSTAAAAANITARSQPPGQQKGRRRSAPAAAKGTHNPINPADGSTSAGLSSRAAAPGPQLQRPVIRQRRRKTPVRHARKRGGGKAREIRGCGNRRNAVCAKNTRAPAR